MNSFQELTKQIKTLSIQNSFKEATNILKEYIDLVSKQEFITIVQNIGTIPENIIHDSSEEKLYSKASDIVLARCFRILGLSSKALEDRADSADIIAESIHGYQYSLVADSKCFRLSRTAKNQKDFKISNLSDWRGSENEYAVLVAPYFQYPKVKSQIFSKALEHNVCLLSWEHIYMLITNGLKESECFSLESIWNISNMIARDSKLAFNDRQKNFINKVDQHIVNKLGIEIRDFNLILSECKNKLILRGKSEIEFWENKITNIKNYTKEQAIEELIKSMKLYEKINIIESYIKCLEKGNIDE